MAVVVAICALSLPVARHATAADFAAECAPAAGPLTLTIGAIDCRRMQSEAMGGVTAFSYFVPPNCDPVAHPDRRCPVLYWLHGAGSSYRTIGPQGSSSAPYVRALTAGPPVDPAAVDDPWNYSDPSMWVERAPLDMIVIYPQGGTLVQRGPAPGGSTGWADWNPRYDVDGDTPRYGTQAPEVRRHLVEELVPYVDAHFPTIADRTGRAMLGRSLGGFGTFHNGLARPDLWSSLGMISGVSFSFPEPEDDAGSPIGFAPPADVPYQKLPGVVPAVVPDVAWGPELHGPSSGYGAMATVGFGDIVTDAVWWRKHNPSSLARNARAYAKDGRQVLHLRYFHGDAIPRRAEDLEDPTETMTASATEAIGLPTNVHLESVFEHLGVEQHFEIHPGVHNQLYANAWLRAQYESQYAHIAHWDGTGNPFPKPVVFDYRSAEGSFDIWGWHFETDRVPLEFLDLTGVSCDTLTLRGTGTVTVTVPAKCRTGVGGERTFAVDLGPDQATDDVGGGSTSSAYGKTIHVDLVRIHGNGP